MMLKVFKRYFLNKYKLAIMKIFCLQMMIYFNKVQSQKLPKTQLKLLDLKHQKLILSGLMNFIDIQLDILSLNNYITIIKHYMIWKNINKKRELKQKELKKINQKERKKMIQKIKKMKIYKNY